MVKNALIHVDDTEKILDLAAYLADSGWTIRTANKTEELLKREKIPVVHEKLLTDNIQYLKDTSGFIRQLMSSRYNQEDAPAYAEENGNIFLLCINFEPVLQNVSIKKRLSTAENQHRFFLATILRNSFLNYENIVILTDPADYKEAIIQLRTDNITMEFRGYLAAKALNLVSAFDAGISASMLMNSELKINFMNYLQIPVERQLLLHNGANLQQEAALYKFPSNSGIYNNYQKLQGKELTYNAISDVSVALDMISMLYTRMKSQYSVKSTNNDGYSFTTQFTPLSGNVFTIAVKHKTILGAALSTNVLTAFKSTYVYDTENIRDVTLGCSSVIDEYAAEEIASFDFATIVAPEFTKRAREILAANKCPRLLTNPLVSLPDYDLQLVNGGILLQTKDSVLFNHWSIKTKKRPSQNITDELAFGTMLTMGSRSCSAILIKNNALVGSAQGCKSSTSAVGNALHEAKAYYKTRQPTLYAENQVQQLAEVLVCDTTIRLTEDIKTLIASGLSAIIQTGGDKDDEAFISYCDEHNVIMVFTGMTHLSH